MGYLQCSRAHTGLPTGFALRLLYIGNESAPVQLAQCRFSGLAISSAKMSIYFLKIKYTETNLPRSTRKLLRLEITKMLIAVYEKNFIASFIRPIIFGAHLRSL